MDNREVAYIMAARVMAVDTVATLETPHFANVSAYFINGTNETAAPPDYGMWFTNALQIYPDLLGPIAYLMIFLIPYAMLWISNGDTKLISILGMITSLFVFVYVKGAWQVAAVLVFILSLVTVMWRIYRGN
jgi:hypothetical protein